MERERLARLVETPEAVLPEDLVGLGTLADRYPWFAGAQVLRALGEHRAGDVLSEETLHKAAVHVPSRTVLFDLVNKPVPHAAPSLTVVHSTEVVSEKVQPEVGPTALPSPTEPPAPEAFALEPVFTEFDLGPQPDGKVTETDPLERQIMEAALASAYDLTWSEGPAPEVGAPAPASTSVPAPALAQEARATETYSNQPVAGTGPTVHRSARLKFTDWLDTSVIPADPITVVKPDEAVPSGAANWLRNAPTDNTEEATSAPTLPKAPADTKSLIDRFINQHPPAPPKTAFFTPQQAAKRSLDDTAGIVTETLARVYEKQGNLPKAIDAYRRLALKYPAKSAYFAALAKELEAQLNK